MPREALTAWGWRPPPTGWGNFGDDLSCGVPERLGVGVRLEALPDAEIVKMGSFLGHVAENGRDGAMAWGSGPFQAGFSTSLYGIIVAQFKFPAMQIPYKKVRAGDVGWTDHLRALDRSVSDVHRSLLTTLGMGGIV